MRQQAIDIPTLAEDLMNVDRLFDRRDERLALALYRLLGEGEPVSEERLAARAGRSLGEVAEWLRGARVELDERGEVVAFQGLTLSPTEHVVEVDGRTLYGGCAADTLFLPELLGRPARVRSTDPITGRTVSLSLKDGGVRELKPSTAVQSMAVPDADGAGIGADAIPAACGPINFFATVEAGRAFTERVQGTFLLTIEEGIELGRLINRAVYGSALGDDGR